MKVEVDFNRCVGLGICEATASGYFEVGGDARVQILRAEVQEDDLAEVEEAVHNCPTAALRLTS